MTTAALTRPETEPTPAEMIARAAHAVFMGGQDRWDKAGAKAKASFIAEAEAGLRALRSAGYRIEEPRA